MPQKVSSSSFVARLGCSCDAGGSKGGRAGVQLLPVTWGRPVRHLLGTLRQEGGGLAPGSAAILPLMGSRYVG